MGDIDCESTGCTAPVTSPWGSIFQHNTACPYLCKPSELLYSTALQSLTAEDAAVLSKCKGLYCEISPVVSAMWRVTLFGITRALIVIYFRLMRHQFLVKKLFKNTLNLMGCTDKLVHSTFVIYSGDRMGDVTPIFEILPFVVETVLTLPRNNWLGKHLFLLINSASVLRIRLHGWVSIEKWGLLGNQVIKTNIEHWMFQKYQITLVSPESWRLKPCGIQWHLWTTTLSVTVVLQFSFYTEKRLSPHSYSI